MGLIQLSALVPSIVFGLLTLCFPRSVRAERDAEDLTVAAMCRAGLRNSAVEYVKARRGLVSNDASAAAKWTMRLMECHALAALQAPGKAEADWQRCLTTMRDFLSENPDNNRAPWLRWQLARCRLLQAQAEVATYRAAPANTAPRAAALTLVRELLSELESLQSEIARLQPLAARRGPTDTVGAVTVEQLNQLSVDSSLMRCEGLLIRGRLYPPGSPDRIASASDTERVASETLSRSEPNWPSRDALLAARSAAQLELGRQAEALEELERLARSAADAQVRVRAASLAIEALLANRQASRAASLVPLIDDAEGGPEVWLAEIQIALSDAATQTGDDKQRLLAQVLEKSKLLGQRYGDYWRSRGEALLIASGQVSQSQTDSAENANVALELLTARVRQLLAAGDNASAIEYLLKFSQNEAAAERGDSALRVASQAAALYQRQSAWLPAAEVLSNISQQFPQAEGAAAAHLQAAFCLTQALRSAAQNNATSDTSDLQNRYEELLLRQLSMWPRAAVTDEAEQWLTQWLSIQGRHPELASALLGRAVAALAGDPDDTSTARVALSKWLGVTLNLQDSIQVNKQLAQLAQARKTSQLEPLGDAAALMELLVQTVSSWPTSEERSQRLRQLAHWNSTDDYELQSLALAARVLEAIREYAPAEAGKTTDDLSLPANWQPYRLEPSVRAGLSRGLIAAVDELPAGSQAEVAKELQFDADWAELLMARPEALNRALGLRILLWGNNPSQELLDELRRLVESAGRSGGELQLQLAHALVELPTPDFEGSSQLAKQLIANTPAGSELHLAARWRLIRNLAGAGQREKALRAADLVLATQPSLSDIWRQRFSSVAAR